MSWEEVSNEKASCPCGHGTYSVINELDDWHGARSTFVMDCPKCNGKYVLYTYEYDNSGLQCQGHRWIGKKSYEKAISLQESAEKKLEKALLLSRERYLHLWLSNFEGKSKKAIWSVLTDKGSCYPALGTFYNHVKSEGLEKYLTRFFNNENQKALNILCISDNELSAAFNIVENEKKAADTLLNGKSR